MPQINRCLLVVSEGIFLFKVSYTLQERLTMAKKKEKKRIEICIECGEKTENYYSYSINKGKIIRCAQCHELNVIRSTKFDTKLLDSQEIKGFFRE